MKLPDIDELLIPLPPLDGDAEDAEEEEAKWPGEPEDLDTGLPPGRDEDSRDDATDETLELGDSIEPTLVEEAAWNEAEERAEVDVGEDALVGEEDADREPGQSQDDDDLPGVAPPCDFVLDDDSSTESLTSDQAEEGPIDPSGVLVDDELPPIDADEEGDLGGEFELATDFADALDRAADPCASELSWRAVESTPLPLPIGPVDFDATVLIDPAVAEGAVLLTSRHGIQRVVGRNREPESRNLWREHGASPLGVLPRGHQFLAALGRKRREPVLWVVTPSGHLLRGEEDGRIWEDRGPVPGACSRALCAKSDGGLVLLCGSGADLCLAFSEGGSGWRKQHLAATLPFCDDESRLWVAGSRSEVVVGHGSGAVVTRDGGRSFHPLSGAKGAVAGAFTAEVGGALIVALRRPEDGISLARSNDRDELELIARIDASSESEQDQDRDDLDSDLGDASESQLPLALAADEERGIVWLWWRDVLSAWGPQNLQ